MHWFAYKLGTDGTRERCELPRLDRDGNRTRGRGHRLFVGSAQPAILWGDGDYVIVWRTNTRPPRELWRLGPRAWTTKDAPHDGPPQTGAEHGPVTPTELPPITPLRVASSPAPSSSPAAPTPSSSPVAPAPSSSPAASATSSSHAQAPHKPGNGASPPLGSLIQPVAPDAFMAQLASVVGLFERLHALSSRDADRSIAQIQAQAMVAIEAERARCSATLAQTQEHWQALRTIERESRESAEARAEAAATRAMELADQAEGDRADMEAQLDELAKQLRRPAKPGEQSALDKLQPLIAQLAPALLPRLLAWIDGNGAAPRGSLQGDGGDGG